MIGPKALRECARFVDWLIMQGIDRQAAVDQVNGFAERLVGKRPKKFDAKDINLGEYIKFYIVEYTRLYREEPVIPPKEFALAALLLRKFGVQLCVDRTRALAVTKDPFFQKIGFSITSLYSQWNKLAAASAVDLRVALPGAPADCRHVPRCRTAIDHNQKYVRDARTSPSVATTSRRPIT